MAEGRGASEPRTMAALATMPGRPLEAVLRALRPQVTRLAVVCNGYTEPPAIVQALADEWVCDPENRHGDMGKLRWTRSFVGLYLCCDDDIAYPPDYAAVMRRWVRRWKGRALVTFHGRLLPARAAHFQSATRRFAFRFTLGEGAWINYAGSGVLGFDTRLMVPRGFAPELGRNNTDASLALWAQQHHVPIWVAPHQEGWLRDLNAPGASSLYAEAVATNSRRPNAVIRPWAKAHGWAVYRAA